MAVFGDLADFTLVDILKIVRTKTGVLYLYSALGGRSLELTLSQNVLLSMYIDGFPVMQPERASQIVLQLTQEAHGKFSFETDVLDQLTRHYTLPLDPILRHSTMQQPVLEAELPHPQTVFRVADPLPPVPVEMQAQWNLARFYLQRGTNSEDLAAALGIPLRDTLTLLYRWRSATLIELMRSTAAEATSPASVRPAPAVTRETRSLLSRLISRLRGEAVN